MPTIISGLDPSVRMNAYLAGQKFQTVLQEQQAEEEREISRQRSEFLKTMQNFRAQEAKALADVNARAQLGEAQALQQQMLAAKAAGLPPDQKMAMEAVKILGGITDPDVRAMATKDVQGYLGGLEQERQKEAAMKFLEKRIQDGKLDAEQLQLRMQTGEEPEQIAKEEQANENKEAAALVAQQENEEFALRAEQLAASIPKGTKSARRAGFIVQRYRNSPSDQQKPGEGANIYKMVQDASILEAGEEKMLKEQIATAREKTRGEAEAAVPSGTSAMNFGADIVGGQPARKGARQAVQKTLKRTGKGGVQPAAQPAAQPQAQPTDPANAAQAIIAQMRSQGIPITPENLQAVKASLRGQGAPTGAQ